MIVDYPTVEVMPSIVSYKWFTLWTQRLEVTHRHTYLLIKREKEDCALTFKNV